MGRRKLYLKNTAVIEQLSKVDTIVFDKTGTLTSSQNQQIYYHGTSLNKQETEAVKNIVRGSNHPLSRRLYTLLPGTAIEKPDMYEEVAGKGIKGRSEEHTSELQSRPHLVCRLLLEKKK